jgi:capsular polysaccharide biosynthesis protein
MPREKSFQLQRDALLWLRQQTQFLRSHEVAPANLLLARRQSARSLAPKRSIPRIAARRGYAVIDPGELALDAQVSAFSSAERICSPSGAMLANMLFMKEGTEVRVAYSAVAARWQGWRKLAELFDIKLVQVTGLPLTLFPARTSAVHARVWVNPFRLVPRLRRRPKQGSA